VAAAGGHDEQKVLASLTPLSAAAGGPSRGSPGSAPGAKAKGPPGGGAGSDVPDGDAFGSYEEEDAGAALNWVLHEARADASLAAVDGALGNLRGSRDAHAAALAARLRAVGGRHPDVAASLLALAEAHLALGQLADGLATAARAVEALMHVYRTSSVEIKRAVGAPAVPVAPSPHATLRQALTYPAAALSVSASASLADNDTASEASSTLGSSVLGRAASAEAIVTGVAHPALCEALCLHAACLTAQGAYARANAQLSGALRVAALFVAANEEGAGAERRLTHHAQMDTHVAVARVKEGLGELALALSEYEQVMRVCRLPLVSLLLCADLSFPVPCARPPRPRSIWRRRWRCGAGRWATRTPSPCAPGRCSPTPRTAAAAPPRRAATSGAACACWPPRRWGPTTTRPPPPPSSSSGRRSSRWPTTPRPATPSTAPPAASAATPTPTPRRALPWRGRCTGWRACWRWVRAAPATR